MSDFIEAVFEFGKILLGIFIVIVVVVLVLFSSSNVDWLKQRAEQTWATQGFEIVGYEGYEWGFRPFPDYGGAKVWHQLRKVPDNGITYSGNIQRWGDEVHVYGPTAIDAIRPK